MCIIVAIPAGVSVPSDDTLKECFTRNPDGAGFMWSDGKQVNIRKGFMTWSDFKEALDTELDSGRIYDDSAMVLHFRITTSGKTQPSCCHPFPISDRKEDLQALSIRSRFGIAHNGIIMGRDTSDGWSDTMDYVAGVVAPLARMHPSFMYSDDAKKLLEETCMSKLAIINHAGEMVLVGDFKEDGGVFYSNASYIPVRWDYSSYGNWWSSQRYDEKDYGAPFGSMDKLVGELKFSACEFCENNVECVEYGEWCSDEWDAVETCADSNGCSKMLVMELLGWVGDEWYEMDGM